MNIRSNLIYFRKKMKLTQRELGRLTSLSFMTINRIETLATNPDKASIETVSKLAAYFNVSLDDFVHKDLSKEESVTE